jgi:transposase
MSKTMFFPLKESQNSEIVRVGTDRRAVLPFRRARRSLSDFSLPEVRINGYRRTMSTHFINVDRRTPMLLPPDMKDWVKNDDLVHFILEGVEGMDLSSAAVNQRGSGNSQYPPGMMLAVLIYSYAIGIFSSRRIERATYQDISVRYLSGDTHPDHDTIAKFRRDNGLLIRKAFIEVLELGQELGFLRMGLVSIDGTKLRGNASKRQTLRQREIEEQLGKIEKQVEEILDRAENADKNDREEGMSLPENLKDPQQRRAKLEQARQKLAQRVRDQALERQKERDFDLDEPGRPPRALPTEPRPQDTINTTDSDSRLMPTVREGFIQGYNGQLAVSAESRLIVGARVTSHATDRRELLSTFQSIPKQLGTIGAIVADTGYDNQQQIARIEKLCPTKVYCSLQGNPKQSPRSWIKSRRDKLTQQARQKMREKMTSPLGRKFYILRSTTVEPMIGFIKHVMGFRSFLLRGIEKVNIEWQLIALAFNCRRLAKLKRAV